MTSETTTRGNERNRIPSNAHHPVATASITDNGSCARAMSPTDAATLQVHAAIVDGLTATNDWSIHDRIPKNPAISAILPPTDNRTLRVHPLGINVSTMYGADQRRSIPEMLILL